MVKSLKSRYSEIIVSKTGARNINPQITQYVNNRETSQYIKGFLDVEYVKDSNSNYFETDQELSKAYKKILDIIKVSENHLDILATLRPQRASQVYSLKVALKNVVELSSIQKSIAVFYAKLPGVLAQIHKLTKDIKKQMNQQFGEVPLELEQDLDDKIVQGEQLNLFNSNEDGVENDG